MRYIIRPTIVVKSAFILYSMHFNSNGCNPLEMHTYVHKTFTDKITITKFNIYKRQTNNLMSNLHIFNTEEVHFTARAYARAVLEVVILSVCLSHAWIVTKLNDALQIFLYHTKGQSLCYCLLYTSDAADE